MGMGAAAATPALLSRICCFLLRDWVLLSQTMSSAALKNPPRSLVSCNWRLRESRWQRQSPLRSGWTGLLPFALTCKPGAAGGSCAMQMFAGQMSYLGRERCVEHTWRVRTGMSLKQQLPGSLQLI